ncbi:MAG: transcriptional repressor [Calditrichaeota bacterium]|nr:transcriptional repressor [Calditrichota bacterium]MBT7617674.1 transcriptional repressor [Calditrichota bacterium]
MDLNQTYRMTKQRKIIVDVLKKSNDHPTADLIYQKVRRKLPRISLGTVYRNLEILEQIGMIRKINSDGTRMRFEFSSEEHNHIRCTECGSIEDLKIDCAPPLGNISEESGYEVIGCDQEYYGICPSCQKKSQKIA